MRKPACRIAPDQHRRARTARAEPSDASERVEPLLGPAVRELIELHPVRGGDDDHECRDREGQRGADVKARAPRHHELNREEEASGKHGHRDELEEAAARVRRVREAGRVQGVDPSEEIRDLEPDKEDKKRIHRDERCGAGC